MGINLGGFGTGMTQQYLDISQVSALLEKVSGEAVPQAVWSNVFAYLGSLLCITKYPFHTGGTVLSALLTLKQPKAGSVY